MVVFDRHGRVTHGAPRASLPPPPISLFYRPRKPTRSSEGIKLKLQSEPSNPNNNSEYSFFMRFLQPHDTDPENFCDFIIDLKKEIAGQNLQGGPARYRLAKDLLRGHHLYDFNSFAHELGAETIPHFEECMRRLGRQIFPRQSKSRQIFAMRNAVKPERQSIRDFFGRLMDIAVKMEPIEPLGLDDDDWKDILVRAMPEHYISRMFEGGFDPADHDLLETINRLERFETADLVMRQRQNRNPPRGQQSDRNRRRIGRRDHQRRGRDRNFRDRTFPSRNAFPNRAFHNRNSPYRPTHNNFPARRQFNTHANRRNNNFRHGGGNNSNFRNRGGTNNFQRNNGGRRNNNNNNRRFERRSQEANQIHVLRQAQSDDDSDVSL